MAAEIITKEDLQQFKNELLHEIKVILKQTPEQAPTWLKSNEVRKMLNISPGTLQNLRVNGTLCFSKIGNILYYKQTEILKLLEGKKL